ncbi:MAG: carbohydrate kinase family protein [Bellilinea sp.]
MPDVIVVGDIDTDNFYIVPTIPGWDEGILVTNYYEYPGGKGANTAGALSRLGINTGMISACGDDHFGAVAMSGLRNNQVDTKGVAVIPGMKTYYCIMMLDPSGEKAILVVDTGLIYPPKHILQEKLPYLLTAKHAHFIGIDPIRMAETMKAAKEAGLTVSVDLDAGYQGLEACRQAIKWSDVVFLNRQGASTLFPGIEIAAALKRLLAMGPSIAVITSGKQGAFGHDGTTFSSIPAFDVPVIDTTGAGDVFSAAFVYGYLNNFPLETALRFASGAAALSVASIGGQSALSSVERVQAFLGEHR